MRDGNMKTNFKATVNHNPSISLKQSRDRHLLFSNNEISFESQASDAAAEVQITGFHMQVIWIPNTLLISCPDSLALPL